VTVRITSLPELVVVGCGEHAAGTLVPAIQSLGRARLVGCCDLDRARAEQAAHRFNVPNADADAQAMIEQLRPHAVLLAGPPDMHVEVGLHALARGCHVLIEKPPARSTHELEQLASVATDAGLVGMVAHNLRHSAAWRRSLERIDRCRIEAMNVTYHASGPTGERWGLPPAEAFLLTHAVHVFDLFNAVLGPPEATTHLLKDVGGGRFVLTSQWVTPTCVPGTAVVSTCAPRFDWSVQLVTSDACLARIVSPTDVVIHGPRTAGTWGSGQRENWRSRSLDAGYESAGYGAELRHFLDAIIGETVPEPSFADELVVYRVLDDLHAQTGLRQVAHHG
jgi:phthalate 4,5-cis-dihydrodiol dehydrogenase